MFSKKTMASIAMAGAMVCGASTTADAAIVTFDFTGRLTVVNPGGSILAGATPTFDPYGVQAPISASLAFDSTRGLGSATLFVAPFDFLGTGGNTRFYDIQMWQIDETLLLGNMLADWSTYVGIPISMVWDASGMINAIKYAPGGLQVGDVISGNELWRGGSLIQGNIGSVIPATDGLTYGGYTIAQGPAPIATTTWNTTPLCSTANPLNSCMGVNPSGVGPLTNDLIGGSPMIDGPGVGLSVNLDIGSGNSMIVTGISSVPVPPAVWLFGSGLLGLVGVARRRHASLMNVPAIE